MNYSHHLTFLYLICPTIATIINERHQINKRSLLFPQYTILQFTYGVSAPVIFPKRSINLSLCMQCNFELPFNTTQLGPTIVSARSEELDYDLERHDFYKYVIGFLEGFGLNGEKCLMRTVCEVAEIPMHLEESNSLLENIVHYLLTPSEETLIKSFGGNSSYEQFLEAEDLGRNYGKCYEAFPDCPLSLIDLFTKIFHI